MSPKKSSAEGKLAGAIKTDFGSFDRFEEHFKSATKKVEASGWSVLGYEMVSGKLVILQAEKHQNLAIWGVCPLIVCDVWEHAYYLQYQNRRAEYVDNVFEILNWKRASEIYDTLTS